MGGAAAIEGEEEGGGRGDREGRGEGAKGERWPQTLLSRFTRYSLITQQLLSPPPLVMSASYCETHQSEDSQKTEDDRRQGKATLLIHAGTTGRSEEGREVQG